ncbi:organic solute transporter Ostalpha-domain-containing protein [Pholiota molesta]|nr:organic solute transporter Ostalpha-domain-containing protein [Pholiota molesta]
MLQGFAESAPPLFQNGKVVLQTYHIGWIISGAFTLVAVIVSLWLIKKHLQWYTNKREQRYIVRLLFMVPLYAIISFASFLFWNHSTPIILIRDTYEAIVLTAFFYLLLMYLSHDTEEQKRIFLKAGLSVEADNIARKRGQDLAKWVFPLGFVHWKPRDGLYFLQLMKWGVLQYCVVRPTSTLAAVILNYLGLYCQDYWGVGWGHIYITIVMSVSVTIAMYCLLQLYVPVVNDLRSHQPLLKLFSVKAVVFLTFWQATLLSLLTMFGLVKDTKYMTADDINNAIGAILETFEMMLFAFLHIRAFTYKPYSQLSDGNPYPSRTPQWRSLGHAMDFRETFREIWVGCIYMFDSMRGKEPTPDFGVIREVHYRSAFGRQRPYQTNLPQMQDRMISANDLIFPAVQIEIDREVEVVINGKREWLLLGKPDEKQGQSTDERTRGFKSR